MLGRREVFESCFELRQAFDILLQRPDKLMLVTGELWPSTRTLAAEDGKKQIPGETAMEGVEHLGQYVYEMTNAKVAQLRAERGIPEDADIALPEIAEEEEMVQEDDEEPVTGFEVEE
jgi:intron-binding protein aquarius